MVWVVRGCVIVCFLASVLHGQVFPDKTWTRRAPADVGMDAAGLDAFANFLGGRGCVVRHGYMIYEWGDQAIRQDVASACKPVIAHLLFKAVEEGKIPSLDQRVEEWVPCLKDINAALDHKDRAITFRHMATQTSCYGVRELPGEAFDYNDWQMALLEDTLLEKIYGVTYETADEKVLHRLLMEPLGCEDNPTLLAFGPNGREGRLGISVRDFARFGLLYLRQGNWRGKQLISKARATMAVTSPLPNSIPRTKGEAAELCSGQRSLGSERIPDNQTDHYGSYSYLWWTNGVDRHGHRFWPSAPLDTYGAFGHENGQRAVVVIPSLDMVVSWNDTTLGEKPGNPRDEAFRLLMQSLKPGPIVRDPEHPAWFKHKDGGPFYMCGPGDPEGFLYRGKRRADGTRDGDQMALINKLAGTGANCIYLMAVRSHGGDGDATEDPFIGNDPARDLNDLMLEQWETWFTAMDARKIVIYFIFYDDGVSLFGKDLPADGQLAPKEAAFIAGLVDRFEHHRHLIWCVAEEYAEGLSRNHALRIADCIRKREKHGHPIAIHQNDGLTFDFDSGGVFNQFAVQCNKNTADDLHTGTVAAWKNTRGLVNINMAEFADSRIAEPSSGTGEALRDKVWAIAMGGGYSMILGMDIASTPVADLETCGRLVRFMQATRFNETSPHDELARENATYVLANPGKTYIVYASSGDKVGLQMEAGRYHAAWYDCGAGKWLDGGSREVSAGECVLDAPVNLGRPVSLYLDVEPPKLTPSTSPQ